MEMGLARCIFASLALALAGCHPRATPETFAIPTPAATIACVNRDNGFAWTVRLDPAARAVDGWPARFEARRISWRNSADGGAYELDRASGALTIVRASSTGGYMSFDSCTARSAPNAPRPGPR
jgi:hypothetical protein